VKTTIRADKKQDVVLSIGSDDGVKVWLNGEIVHGKNVNRALKCGEDQVKVTLKEGENALLLRSRRARPISRSAAASGQPAAGRRTACGSKRNSAIGSA
jgi:hypothetical protein